MPYIEGCYGPECLFTMLLFFFRRNKQNLVFAQFSREREKKNCIRVKLSAPRRWLPDQRRQGLDGEGVFQYPPSATTGDKNAIWTNVVFFSKLHQEFLSLSIFLPLSWLISCKSVHIRPLLEGWPFKLYIFLGFLRFSTVWKQLHYYLMPLLFFIFAVKSFKTARNSGFGIVTLQSQVLY